ncbi:DNA cytosine methyltransferase [Mastigocladopsis repens]|uniref:DNA cytosine methyltransferase n=1 Tax=Mastigocladopsis repens TaxID=221287 RepID=UPI0008FBCD08
MQPIRTIGLFEGIGGFTRASELVGGFQWVESVEIDGDAQRVLRSHYSHPIHSDIRDYHPQRSAADCIVGGFPCTNTSFFYVIPIVAPILGRGGKQILPPFFLGLHALLGNLLNQVGKLHDYAVHSKRLPKGHCAPRNRLSFQWILVFLLLLTFGSPGLSFRQYLSLVLCLFN